MAATHPEAQWFKGAAFGLFMHWGPYSLKGIEASPEQNIPARGQDTV